MKKTLFATISILLMLFAFVACDGGSQGPTGGDVTESEAKTLAGNYLGSINFSQLIVDVVARVLYGYDTTALPVGNHGDLFSAVASQCEKERV